MPQSKQTGVVIGVVEVVWVVWATRVIGAWSLWWSIGWLGVLGVGARLLAARTFLGNHPPLTAFKHGLALGLQLDGLVHK